MEERHVPVTVSAPLAGLHGELEVELRVTSGGDHAELEAKFLGPTRREHRE
jgi:hypothetical protein